MRYVCLISLIMALCFGTAALAQDESPEDLSAIATQIAEQITKTEGLIAEANDDINNAFDLLGLLEAFGFVVTIVGGAAAIFGVTRFISAQNDLQEARKRFDDEIASSRDRLAKETEQRQREFAELREQLERSTSNATLALSFLPLGESQYKSGDFTGAIDIYQRALKLDALNPIINYRLGYAYTQSGKLEEAEKYLQAALSIEADFAPALATLGYVFRRRGEKMEEGIERITILNLAEKNLVRALELSPKLVDADGESWWGSLGGLFRRRGEIDRAIFAYTEASKVTPNSSYAFSNLALLYMQKNDRARMIETYEKVEKLAGDEVMADVNNYWAYNDLVTSRLALGMIPEAEKTLDRVFTATPDDAHYALEALMDTLNRLADVLEPEKAKPVRDFANRIKVQIEQKKQAAAPKPESLPEPVAGD